MITKPIHLLARIGLASLALGTVLSCSTGRMESNADTREQGAQIKGQSNAEIEAPKVETPAETTLHRVEIDATTTYQTWEGAGASLTAWSPEARAQYRSERWQQLFVDDMGMTVLRVDLLPTPLSSRGRHEPTAIHFGADLEANVALFEYERAPRAAIFGEVAHDLIERGVELKVLASVWTPPHWLKDGATITNNGNDSGGGRLRMDPDNLEQYARYMAAAVTAWERRFEVPIDALSIQNEPRFEQTYSSMALTPKNYAKALAAVATEFQRNGLQTRFFGPEDVGYGPEGDHSRIDQQLAFVRAVMAEPTAGPALHAVAVHGYGGDGIDSRGHVAPENWRYYWSAIEGYGKPSWQTETGGGPPGGLGPVFFANVLFEGITYGQISMWCNWMFSHQKPLDNHSLVGFDLDTDNAKYSVAKHYFRFIRPGARRLKVEPADDDQMRVTAWQDPEATHLSVVLLNQRPGAVKLELVLGEAGRGRTLKRYQTMSGAYFEELSAVVVDGELRVSVELPPISLTTLSDLLSP